MARESKAMDPVSGAGLAASLATLVGGAVSSCQSLWTLQSRLKHVPGEIKRLSEDTKVLQLLLLEIGRSTRADKDAQLPFELRSIWQRIEASLRADLENLQELVHQFQNDLSSSSGARNPLFSRI